MLFEEVLPALRAGKKVRRAGWDTGNFAYLFNCKLVSPNTKLYEAVDFDDWEVVPEPKRVAYYLVRHVGPLWEEKSYEIDKQPEGAVLIPGSEREERQ